MNMKEFVKWVLAVLCGLFVWGIIKVIMFLMMIGSIASSASSASATSGGTKAALPKEGVLQLDMSKVVISEQSIDDMPFAQMQSGTITQVGLLDAINGIKKAAEDPGVKYILLRTDGMSTSLTKLEELRKALMEFRKSGKAVVAYGEMFTSGSYYLASVADKIYTTNHHGGNTFMLGVSGRMMFLKDLLDKLGINYQLIRHGKYKSAGEMYVKNSPSPENLEQNQAMINSIWKTVANETAESRGISVDSLNYFIDNLSISYPEDLVNHSLADEALSVEGFKEKLMSLASKDKYKDVKFISFSDYAASKVKNSLGAKKKIEIIYANGNIIEQDDYNNISGDRFTKIIAKARNDSTVKAVVFRVNSPGGTVLASSKIKEEIDLTRAVKPVIASYGDYAASGGYWISNSCDRIFSNATTLTGSIGVFSAIPEFSGTLDKVIHVNVTPVKSNEHSDMLSLTRPFDTKETAWMQSYVEDIYGRFVGTVAEGRDMTTAAVDSIAQGRVWTGADAIGIGLVDEIGTLTDALEYAAAQAGDADLNSWGIVSYPKPQSQMEQIISMISGKQPDEEDARLRIVKGTPLEDAAKAILDWQKTWVESKNGAPLVFARLPYEIDIR